MPSMTDRTRAAAVMDVILHHVVLPVVFPAASFLINLRLDTVQGSNTGAATECTSGNSPGYTAGGNAITFGANTTGVSTSTSAPTWTATGTWTGGVISAELWDTQGTPLRWFQGALAVAIAASVVLNGDTVTFATGAVTADASAW